MAAQRKRVEVPAGSTLRRGLIERSFGKFGKFSAAKEKKRLAVKKKKRKRLMKPETEQEKFAREFTRLVLEAPEGENGVISADEMRRTLDDLKAKSAAQLRILSAK